jgi:PAS domain S-box-containing protein
MTQSNLITSFNEEYNTFNLDLLSIAIDVSIAGVLITDNRLPDNPIIYCNPGFEKITGYPKAEIIGRNCRFLQGPETDSETVNAIKTKLKKGEDLVIEILNYKKDGTLFYNELHISPIFNAEKTITHFIGIQHDITAKKPIAGLRQYSHEQQVLAPIQDDDKKFKAFLNNLRLLLPKF